MNGDRVLNIKHHSLTGRITWPLMYQAFRRVKRNRGAAGVDKVSICRFEANLAENLHALMRSLKQGTFQPLPARRVYIDKGGGQLRPLGIPVVRDRVVPGPVPEQGRSVHRGRLRLRGHDRAVPGSRSKARDRLAPVSPAPAEGSPRAILVQAAPSVPRGPPAPTASSPTAAST